VPLWIVDGVCVLDDPDEQMKGLCGSWAGIDGEAEGGCFACFNAGVAESGGFSVWGEEVVVFEGWLWSVWEVGPWVPVLWLRYEDGGCDGGCGD